MSYELKFTIYEFKPKVASSSSGVATLNPRARRLKARVERLKVAKLNTRARRLKA